MFSIFENSFDTLDKTFKDFDKAFDSDFFKTSKQAANSILSFSGAFPSFPPVNIYLEKRYDGATLGFVDLAGDYIVELALSGYKSENVAVNVETINGANFLRIESKGINEDRNGLKWFQRGIAGRAFKMSFTIAPNIKVTSAELVDGLLTIRLKAESPLQKPVVQNIPVG